ncbi:MAG TPA: GNAT family N-acetyltransferase [Aquihabitans sp.]|nr:GNAT family N-acetyltransferase [Aquihabitans sp.]
MDPGPTGADLLRGPQLRLRPRTDADLDACGALGERTHVDDGYPVRRPPSMAAFLEAPGALGAWVAEVDGRVAGHVVLAETTFPEVVALAAEATGRPSGSLAVVARLLVDPAARRLGVGRALLRTARDDALARARQPVLEVALELTAGRHLYEAEGWRDVGRVTVFLAADDPIDEAVFIWPIAP